jgi:hypothetical protein
MVLVVLFRLNQKASSVHGRLVFNGPFSGIESDWNATAHSTNVVHEHLVAGLAHVWLQRSVAVISKLILLFSA